MGRPNEFYNLNDMSHGYRRILSPGCSAHIFVGGNAMLSLVTLEPNAQGEIHSHPEEQWGILLEGDGIRVQGGEEVAVTAGDFWRTPGGMPHGFRAGASGARILDIFSPPRKAYEKPGAGFASA